ncbi:MAG: hypothetical protein RPR97_01135 [Colwellia sp.]
MKGDKHSHPWSNLLDVYNTYAYLKENPSLKTAFRNIKWANDDPLSDVLLAQFGSYPSTDDTGTDYLSIFSEVTDNEEIEIPVNEELPDDIWEYGNISSFSCFHLSEHYTVQNQRRNAGIFLGDSQNLEDIVCFWNIRACNVPLLFIDISQKQRYSKAISSWEAKLTKQVSGFRHDWDKKLAIWHREGTLGDDFDNNYFPKENTVISSVCDFLWNGLNISAPMMYLGETSTLGVVGEEYGKTRISFSLDNKPFCDDSWFHQQNLIASISLLSSTVTDDKNTFDVPYIPEINEFYAREMHFHYNKLRVEPERLGIVINANENDSFLTALPTIKLVSKIFEQAGYSAELSNAGLLTKQVIEKLGGLQGGRVFKISGVRNLFKTFGANKAFTKYQAHQLISKNEQNGESKKFNEHSDLFIESRERHQKLTPNSVFGYLIEKDLFKIGSELICPSCQLKSWYPLGSLNHEIKCVLCGSNNNVSRELADLNQWHFRRTGIMGVEKNAQGAVPVCLTLQQLDTHFNSSFSTNIYCPSINLTKSVGGINEKCETDFVWVVPKRYPEKTEIILSECKDQGEINQNDIDNLKKVADSFPTNRFKTYILLSKLTAFTEAEIELAKSLNSKYEFRAILLSTKELEPYHIGYESMGGEKNNLHWHSPSEMASSTAQLYFVDN